jgi:hypothetical protein
MTTKVLAGGNGDLDLENEEETLIWKTERT